MKATTLRRSIFGVIVAGVTITALVNAASSGGEATARSKLVLMAPASAGGGWDSFAREAQQARRPACSLALEWTLFDEPVCEQVARDGGEEPGADPEASSERGSARRTDGAQVGEHGRPVRVGSRTNRHRCAPLLQC